jgi:DNA-binding beta-propeller fold protein YncE
MMRADPPRLIRFEATLTDAAGVPLSGMYDLQLDVYDQAAGGSLLWTDTWTRELNSGMVDIMLGSADPPNPIPGSLFAASDRWVQVTVTPSGGSASVLAPRQRLVSVPYALATERLGTMTLVEVQEDIDGRITAHALNSSEHHVKTADASQLTTGILDNARLNAGPGGGIDADTLDGIDSSAFCLGAACRKTPKQIAMLRWYEAARSGNRFDVDTGPVALAYDGFAIWVTNSFGGAGSYGNVTRLRAVDGALLGTYTAGKRPQGIAFDGQRIWIVNALPANPGDPLTVSRLWARDGTQAGPPVELGTFPSPVEGGYAAFDGTSIWVSVTNTHNELKKIRPSDGVILMTKTVGSNPGKLLFDGVSLWVANIGDDNIMKLDPSDGEVLDTCPVGDAPLSLAFDGQSIWVSNVNSNSVMKVDRLDCTILSTFPFANSPTGLIFDGAHIWVPWRTPNQLDGNITKIRVSDGSVIGIYPVGDNPLAAIFDGSSIWTANNGSNDVSKL